MEIYTMPLGPVQANCYIVQEGKKALIIDPGDEAEKVESVLSSLKAEPEAIVLTHGHFDHIGAVDSLAKHYGIPVYINPKEKEFLKNPALNGSFAFGLPPVILETVPEDLVPGKNEIGDFDLTVYELPGHSVGSSAIEIGSDLFTGDILFKDSIGRTDLATGDPKAMRQSLNTLKSMDWDYRIHPGHGAETTLSDEKAHNPYLIFNLI